MPRALGLALLLFTLGTARFATAEPTSCRELRTAGYAGLSPKARDRLSGGERWEKARPSEWKTKLLVSVWIDRAPHLVKAILEECPGVSVQSTSSADQRNFSSSAQLRITSFAALTRVAQLPAVRSLTVFDPTLRKPHRHPIPHDIDFLD